MTLRDLGRAASCLQSHCRLAISLPQMSRPRRSFCSPHAIMDFIRIRFSSLLPTSTAGGDGGSTCRTPVWAARHTPCHGVIRHGSHEPRE